MAICIMLKGLDPAPWIAGIHAIKPDRDIRIWPQMGDPADIDYAFVWKPDTAALSALPSLKAIFSLGAGVDHIFNGGNPPDVPIVRIVDPDLTNRMSEYVVMHTLVIQRQFRFYDGQQRQKIWSYRHDPAARDIRVGIMGTGVLGADAAQKLAVMGFDVAAWGRTEKDLGAIPVFHGKDGLDGFLARTDILICLLPLTDETRGILNIDLFSKLARDGTLEGPHIINAGRGGLQIEADIVRALDDGVLAGAVLDVFATEPLPEDNPFWSDSRVTVTPHNAALSDPGALTAYVMKQIERLESGRPLENTVDRARGY